MFSTRSTLLLLPIVVSAIPNAPAPTPAAHVDKRANGANTIGFSLSGTSWRTRSCNTGYFSTSGTLGNCCVDNSCNFLTNCVGSTIFYANGNTATCASNTCGAGTILKTVGDQSPLTMFNCQSDWTATETPSATDSSTTSRSRTSRTTDSSTTTSDTSTTSTTETSTPTPSFDGPTSTRAVTMTVTNSDGTVQTTTSVQAVPASSGTPDPNALTSNQENGSGGGSNAGAIAGGVVGGLAVLAIVAGIIGWLVWKRKKASKEAAAGTTTPLNPDGTGPSSPPPAMGENAAWNAGAQGNQGQYMAYNPAQHQSAYGAPPQQPYSQDYKMPLAGGGFADAPGAGAPPPPQPQGPQILDGTPVQPHAPSELYGGTVQGPVEMPAQTGYGR